MVICVNHQKGGVGKSTISWNLAIELAKDVNVQIVDLDVQKTITTCNAVRKDKGLSSLNISSFKDADSLLAFLQKADADDKIILCDTGAYDSPVNRMAASVADILITPVSNSAVELQGLMMYKNIIEELKKSGADVHPYIIFNNVNPLVKNMSEIKNFLKEQKFELLDTFLCRRTDFNSSISVGKSAVEFNENSKAANEIKNLSKEILEKLKKVG